MAGIMGIVTLLREIAHAGCSVGKQTRNLNKVPSTNDMAFL